MNAIEIDRELREDKTNVEDYILSKLTKVKRFIKTRTPFRYYSTFVTNRKNKWLLVWSYTGHDYRTICSFPVCLVETSEGIYAYSLVFNEQAHFSIYVPHFFSRYALRCGIEKKGVELIAHFFYNNLDYTYIHHSEKNPGHSYLVEQVSHDGVSFGFFFKDNIGMLYRTFITHEMAKGEQIPVFVGKEMERSEKFDVEKPEMTPWMILR